MTVTDAVPANTTFVSAVVTTGSGWTIPSPPSVGGTGNVVFSKASVAAGETAVFTIVVKVNSNVASGITITNTATAATTTTDPTSSNDTATATTTTQTAADLVVTKTDSPDPVNAGSNITYTINFSNAGPSDAQNVTVTDAVPANTTFVSAVVTTGSGWTMPSPPSVGGTGNVVFSKVSVVAGESAVFTMVVKVNSNTASGTTISNSAVAASTTNDAVPANNTGTATTTVQTRADLAITKSDSPDPSFAGNNITYTINFTNNGPSDAASVTVTDAVPTNTTFVSATVTTGSGWTIPSPPAVGGTGNVVFSKDPVAAGETAVFTIVVKVDASTPTGTTITNTATAATTTTDPDSSNNTATATTDIQAQADLTIDKTGLPSPDVVAGNNMTYTINFTNNGPGAATSVTVTDPTPANTTFVSATVTTGSGWTMPSPPSVGGTGTVTFSKATVANGETAVFTIVVKVNSSTPNNTTITNTATAASTTADPNTNDNTDAFMVNAIRQVDLYLTKTASPTPNVIAGNDITYTINFTNNGPSDASNVTVTDAVPAGTSLVSAMVTTGSGWSTNTSGPIVFSKSAVTAGETAVFTIVVHVPSSTANGTNITNTATAAATETDTDPITNTASASISVITRADLAVTKTDSPDPVIAGNNLTYTINFSNAGPSDAQTVTVSDAVPANTSFVSAVVTTGTGWSVNTSGPIVFSKATVAGGETAVFTIVVKVNANTANGTVISNSATAATTTTDPTAGNNTDTATTTVQTQADLAVTKTDTPDPAFAGGNITYTINFSNNGPSDAQTVTVTDAVPSNTTFVSAVVTTGSGWTIPSPPSVGGTGTVTFSKSTVAASETAVFTIVVKVDANTASGTVISNSATAATTTTDPTAGNNTGTATTTIQTEADLAVTKSDSPDPVIAGNNLTYTINFVNNGPSDAQTVTVTDAVPANTTFVSAVVTTGSGWTIPSPPSVGGTGNVVFSKATVTNGETAVFTIVVKVNANTANGATISNSAVAAATTGDGNSANNTAMATTTVQTQADLAVTKSDSPDPVIAGNDLTYTINFVNNGPSDAQSVTVSDAVPANTSFVSAVVTTGTGWSVNTSGPIVFSKATVAAGETAVFTIVVKVNANTANGTVISNSATAATTTTDPTAGNNTSTATTTVQTQADLAVTKTDTPDPVFAGNNITYTINFVNNGPSDAQTVTVTDPIPANTTFVSAVVTTGTGWSVNAPPPGSRPGKGVPTPTGNVVFSKSTVAASETAVFTIVVKVNSSAANGSTITNTATAASTTTDPTAGNNSATAMTTVQTQADLALTKTDSPDPVVASQNLTYTLTLNNNGPSDAQTVSVSDAVPANTTFVSATVTTGSGWSTSQPSVGGTGTVTFSKATMAGGETAVFTIVVNVNSGTANNTVITNTATATTATTDPTPVNNTATATTTVIAQADLAVTKSDSPDPVCVNGNLTYTINFVDNGPGPGLNTTVTDAVPVNTTFVSATVTTGSGWSTSQPSAGGTGNVVFSKANVANGETAVFTIVVKVNAGVLHGTVITNSVTAASSIPDPTPGNNTAMTTTTVDPIAPTITCPANITSMAQLSCPNTTTAVVNFAPTVTDNCAATYVCSPASGSAFPVGTTTVSCTATDTAGNTASCSFTVKVWSACLQDESNPGNVVLFNSQTGEYQFCCNGVVTATGTGTVSVRGCVVQFDHIKGNRKVNIRADLSQMRGTATVIIANQSTCVITDMNMANNSCQCPTGVKP
ncbi:MAG TPA: HYR domain-containing protein [Blastocatellia bacterium]|nr:HYR domain-containing protein [Blastocatellia bacterium]